MLFIEIPDSHIEIPDSQKLQIDLFKPVCFFCFANKGKEFNHTKISCMLLNYPFSFCCISNVWIGTKKGLSRYNIQTKDFKSYHLVLNLFN